MLMAPGCPEDLTPAFALALREAAAQVVLDDRREAAEEARHG